MSNPGTAPVPRPPRPRSFFGPLVLIGVGVVFMLINAGYISWRAFGLWFAKWWPLVIILWGLAKLLEYYHAQREGYPYRGLGGGSVFLLIVLIMFGMAISSATRVNWPAVIDVDDEDWVLFGRTFSFSEELEQDFPDNASLKVVSDRGDVTITAWDQKRIKVMVRKSLGADNEQEAQRVHEATKPSIAVAGNLVTVNANTGGHGGHRPVRSNLEIFVPETAAVEVALRRGDVLLAKRTGNVQISTTNGDVDVHEITGNLNVSMRRGDLRATRINGAVVADGRINEARVTEVSGTVTLTGEFPDSIALSKIAKPVTFRSTRTDLTFSKLDGELTVDGDDLRAAALAGPLRLETRAKNIHIEDFTGDLHIENDNGSIEVRPGRLPLGNIDLSNSRGGIQLVLPDKANFQIEARADRGEVNSDFQGVQTDNSDHSGSAKGSVGSGGARTRQPPALGAIEIPRGSSLPLAPHGPDAPRAPEAPRAPRPPRAPNPPQPGVL